MLGVWLSPEATEKLLLKYMHSWVPEMNQFVYVRPPSKEATDSRVAARI
jgi:hypothetical protein